MEFIIVLEVEFVVIRIITDDSFTKYLNGN